MGEVWLLMSVWKWRKGEARREKLVGEYEEAGEIGLKGRDAGGAGRREARWGVRRMEEER